MKTLDLVGSETRKGDHPEQLLRGRQRGDSLPGKLEYPAVRLAQLASHLGDLPDQAAASYGE
jgi:hypothetical protein